MLKLSTDELTNPRKVDVHWLELTDDSQGERAKQSLKHKGNIISTSKEDNITTSILSRSSQNELAWQKVH